MTPRTQTQPALLVATLTSVLMSTSSLFADDPSDFHTTRGRAESGDAAAQAALAVRLRDGKGVEKDDAAAMQWAHRAADAGNADAMDFVGFAYLRGAVVKRNPVIAFGYFTTLIAAIYVGGLIFLLFYVGLRHEQAIEQVKLWFN